MTDFLDIPLRSWLVAGLAWSALLLGFWAIKNFSTRRRRKGR